MVELSNLSGRIVRTGPLRRAIELALQAHGRQGTVSVLLTTDEHIAELNGQFRGMPDATDVLSFPSGELPSASIGDVAISIDYAARQAEARGVSLQTEVAYLGIHGTLHLLGFEDETDSERESMMQEMNRIGAAAGLPPDPEWWSLLHGDEEAAQ